MHVVHIKDIQNAGLTVMEVLSLLIFNSKFNYCPERYSWKVVSMKSSYTCLAFTVLTYKVSTTLWSRQAGPACGVWKRQCCRAGTLNLVGDCVGPSPHFFLLGQCPTHCVPSSTWGWLDVPELWDLHIGSSRRVTWQAVHSGCPIRNFFHGISWNWAGKWC